MRKIFLLALLCLSGCYQPTKKASHCLFVALNTDPCALHPPKIFENSGKTFAHLFYEGLTRLDKNGDPQLALADEILVSPDQLTYTFKLRTSFWSNGEPVTAMDFERSWKAYIDPAHPAQHAAMLYLIKGGREVSEGSQPIDTLEVYAKDPETLVVNLYEPVPYFLKLLATFFYYPYHASGHHVSNGPFLLKHWIEQNEIIAIKNPHYWDQGAVNLEEITFAIVDNNTALRLYEKGELDVIGAPISRLPPDAIPLLSQNDDFFTSPAYATFYITINVDAPPFNRKENRQLFRDSLERKIICEHVLQGNQAPAYRFVPNPSRSPLFQEKIEKISSDLPEIVLTYSSSEVNHKIAQALQDQWRVNLGVKITLQSVESKIYFEKIRDCDFQMCLGGWFADYSDPVSFLEVFEDSHNGMNNSNWENQEYRALLHQSNQESDTLKRLSLLDSAETILIEETPIIPLFFYVNNYVHSKYVSGLYFSELGYIDFKLADVVRIPE